MQTTQTSTRPDWQTLTEQTDYRVLTLPTGETISASALTIVRLAEAEPATDWCPAFGRRVLIAAHFLGRVIEFDPIYEDVDLVFDVATKAHRMHGGRR